MPPFRSLSEFIAFYVPFGYVVRSRLTTPQLLLSWLLVYLFPQLALAIGYAAAPIGESLVLVVLSIVAWQAAYELGYIQNDVVTTRKEENPTLRLDGLISEKLKQSLLFVVAIRTAIVLAMIFAIYGCSTIFDATVNLGLGLLTAFCGLVAFLAHNATRSRWNVVTYYVLATSRFLFPIALVVDEQYILHAFIISSLAMPIPRSMEHATKPKYGFSRWSQGIGDHHAFRVRYYTILTTISILLWLTSISYLLDVAIALYYLLYRSLIALALRRGALKATIYPSYRR